MNWKPKDKLYVNPYGWNSHPSSRKDEVEYIRKDSLLEWAKEGKKQLKSEDAAAIKDDIRYGANAAFDTLIEKLNSL